jgi:hypothetical protein
MLRLDASYQRWGCREDSKAFRKGRTSSMSGTHGCTRRHSIAVSGPAPTILDSGLLLMPSSRSAAVHPLCVKSGRSSTVTNSHRETVHLSGFIAKSSTSNLAELDSGLKIATSTCKDRRADSSGWSVKESPAVGELWHICIYVSWSVQLEEQKMQIRL